MLASRTTTSLHIAHRTVVTFDVPRSVPHTYDIYLQREYTFSYTHQPHLNRPPSSPCSSQCPTFADPLGGLGSEAARDCSGRGLCDYAVGKCACFPGFVGSGCQAVDEGLR
jgi:hypothetical protein